MPVIRRSILLVLALLVAAPAHAAPTEAPDLEIAKRHFERGLALYDQSEYAAAIVEFGRAKEVRPSPELEFNIARCYDRLEQAQPAIEAYERFLAQASQSAGAAEARTRVDTLRKRKLEEAPPPTRRRYLGPVILGASALVVAGVAAGLVGSVAPPFHSLEIGQCASYCDPSVYSGLEKRATAGYVLFGIAGALAIEDVIWLGIAARKHR
jgi:tetratricopeptide (TPR) repeat protein